MNDITPPESDETVATRYELRQFGWALIVILIIGVGASAIIARSAGPGMLVIGVAVGAYVLLAFGFIIGANLAGVALWRRWTRWREKRSRHP